MLSRSRSPGAPAPLSLAAGYSRDRPGSSRARCKRSSAPLCVWRNPLRPRLAGIEHVKSVTLLRQRAIEAELPDRAADRVQARRRTGFIQIPADGLNPKSCQCLMIERRRCPLRRVVALDALADAVERPVVP